MKTVRNIVINGYKKCTGCAQICTIREFYKRKDGYWFARCKHCVQARLHKRNRTNETPASYGLTLEKYEAMVVLQNGRCALCNELPTKRRLDIDHCHTTGKIRGLLCNRCNQGLGLFKENTKVLRAAIQYLERED